MQSISTTVKSILQSNPSYKLGGDLILHFVSASLKIPSSKKPIHYGEITALSHITRYRSEQFSTFYRASRIHFFLCVIRTQSRRRRRRQSFVRYVNLVFPFLNKHHIWQLGLLVQWYQHTHSLDSVLNKSLRSYLSSFLAIIVVVVEQKPRTTHTAPTLTLRVLRTEPKGFDQRDGPIRGNKLRKRWWSPISVVECGRMRLV